MHKKEGGIRMAVDYREVNQFLRVSANQLPYQDMLFQQLGGTLYYAKVDNLWGYHQLKLDPQSSRVIAIITPWVYRFLSFPFGISTAPASIKPEWLIKCWMGIILMMTLFKSMIRSMGKTKKFLEMLDMVLGRMSHFNVRLKPSENILG